MKRKADTETGRKEFTPERRYLRLEFGHPPLIACLRQTSAVVEQTPSPTLVSPADRARRSADSRAWQDSAPWGVRSQTRHYLRAPAALPRLFFAHNFGHSCYSVQLFQNSILFDAISRRVRSRRVPLSTRFQFCLRMKLENSSLLFPEASIARLSRRSLTSARRRIVDTSRCSFATTYCGVFTGACRP